MADFANHQFKSGKHAGKSYKEVIETEEGRSTFRWMLSQELPNEPDKEKLKFWLINRNKWINEQLELHPEDPELTETQQPKDNTALTVIATQVADHEKRLTALEVDKWPEEE